MFSSLIEFYLEYTATKKAVPYNPDAVQAQGLRFAPEWNRLKSEICAALGEPEDNFDYNKYNLWMPRVITHD